MVERLGLLLPFQKGTGLLTEQGTNLDLKQTVPLVLSVYFRVAIHAKRKHVRKIAAQWLQQTKHKL